MYIISDKYVLYNMYIISELISIVPNNKKTKLVSYS